MLHASSVFIRRALTLPECLTNTANAVGRYPALWTPKHVDSLPNPDPTVIEALDEHAIAANDVKIDEVAEAARPEHEHQAQKWAGINQDPHSDLFVFVDRLSKQKGVDLIADILPSLYVRSHFRKHPLDEIEHIGWRNGPQSRVIAVGPVIDLYGRFAAEQLARLMELYHDRVYSKAEFTALPPILVQWR
jgi:alpha-1,3-glucan synthase